MSAAPTPESRPAPRFRAPLDRACARWRAAGAAVAARRDRARMRERLSRPKAGAVHVLDWLERTRRRAPALLGRPIRGDGHRRAERIGDGAARFEVPDDAAMPPGAAGWDSGAGGPRAMLSRRFAAGRRRNSLVQHRPALGAGSAHADARVDVARCVGRRLPDVHVAGPRARWWPCGPLTPPRMGQTYAPWNDMQGLGDMPSSGRLRDPADGPGGNAALTWEPGPQARCELPLTWA